MTLRHFGLALLAGSLGSFTIGSASAQSVISAHSGVIHYVEGRALLAGEEVNPKFGVFPDMKTGQELRTEEGRAEVLLTPGVFLRLKENSAVRMISNNLSDTKIEFLSGSALVECAEILPYNSISFSYKDRVIALTKNGLYRFDSDPAEFRVFEGEAVLTAGGDTVTVKHGKQVALDSGVLVAEKFDAKATDEFYRWAGRRASYLAVANVSAAKSSYSSSYWGGSSSSGGGMGGGMGRWGWNPFFGMFTFIPGSGIYCGAFGNCFFSPWAAYDYYYTPIYYGNPVASGPGTGGGSGTGWGHQPPRTRDQPRAGGHRIS